eukprot:4020012-Amphidinium_carterae.1
MGSGCVPKCLGGILEGSCGFRDASIWVRPATLLTCSDGSPLDAMGGSTPGSAPSTFTGIVSWDALVPLVADAAAEADCFLPQSTEYRFSQAGSACNARDCSPMVFN